MTIREATHEDLDVLLLMARAFLASTLYGKLAGHVSRYQLEGFLDDVLARGVVLLAEDEGRIVGALAVLAGVHAISGHFYADEQAWWVEPDARAAGIGEALLDTCESWARAHGLWSLKMVAPAGSTIGAFYERKGYAEVETAWMKVLVP